MNNASISGYAYFPATTTYAAAKAGVVAFSESLRRELRGTGVGVLHLVTPGVETDMMDDTRQVYGRHIDTSSWQLQPAPEWAAKVVRAIRSDAHVLGPGGRSAIAKLASRGPAFLLDAVSERIFSREPRGLTSPCPVAAALGPAAPGSPGSAAHGSRPRTRTDRAARDA